MAKFNRNIKKQKEALSSSQNRNTASLVAVTESTEQGMIFRKFFLQGKGRLALYAKKYIGCQRMELEWYDTAWQFKYKKQRLIVRKQTKGQIFLITLPEGIVYWETELGYVASFWKKNYLKKIEIGNYTEGHIECILCTDNEFQGPYKLEKNQKLLQPFTRFLLSIKPFGYAML